MISLNKAATLCIVGLVTVCVHAADESAIYEAAVAAPDRPNSDKGRDESRRPAEILEFMRLKPGMTAVEFGAGGGYTTELVARVVGPEGRVFAQALSASRTSDDRLPNVVALEKHLLWEARDKLHDAGLADGQADRVLIFFAVHDMYLNDRIDKQRLYRDILALLRPGGYLVILDNAAEADSGLRDTNSTHRIGELFVREEIEKAGFEFSAESDVLRNPKDKLDEPWNRPAPYRQPGFQDRFAYRFVKP
ncbi:MAG: class I SAM-dependent methyltransferase [Gammaproteobacteria bacterium]